MALSKAEREFHRKTAVSCFNRTWDYLLKKNLDPKAGQEMLHLAHASRYHWGVLGGAHQQAVGDWQVSRAYSALGDSGLALQFALSSLSLCERKHLDGLVPSAMEGVARAYAVAKDRSNATRLIKMARAELGRLRLDTEDWKIFETQIRETEALIERKGVRR